MNWALLMKNVDEQLRGLSIEERYPVSSTTSVLFEKRCFNKDACIVIIQTDPSTARSPRFHGMFRRDGNENGVAHGIGFVKLHEESETEFGVKSTEVAVGQYRLSREGRSSIIRHSL